MKIRNEPLDWYIEKLQKGEHFAVTSMGDGEWIAVFKDRVGSENAEGTVYTKELCDDLASTLAYQADNFFHSTPGDLEYTGLTGRIDKYLQEHDLDIEFLDKNVWDKAVRAGELGPFIGEIRRHATCVVSNEAMQGLYFLNARAFVEVGYPNAYENLVDAVNEAASVDCAVYIVAMGLAGPVFVRELHKRIGNRATIIEIGSCFDIFCGMGGQRGWRSECYIDPRKVLEVRRKNLDFLYDNEG